MAWWDKYVTRLGIPALSIRAAHVMVLGALPHIHKDPFDKDPFDKDPFDKDPFDRILAAQAKVETIPLVSKDAHLSKFGIPIIW